MKNDYTHITLILDRTGSMESIRSDTIGGFNAFLKQQKEVDGEATLSLIQFDSQDPFEIIHDFKPIALVPDLSRETYVPRAATPLLDAMGRGINNLEENLGKFGERGRPSKVIMAVITDGHENASREFSKGQIREMIEKKSEEGWQFVFLSADLDSFGDAVDYGFRDTARLRMSRKGVQDSFQSLSHNMTCFRSNFSDAIDFSEEDQSKQDSLDQS